MPPVNAEREMPVPFDVMVPDMVVAHMVVPARMMPAPATAAAFHFNDRLVEIIRIALRSPAGGGTALAGVASSSAPAASAGIMIVLTACFLLDRRPWPKLSARAMNGSKTAMRRLHSGCAK